MRQSSWRMRWIPAIAFALIAVVQADVLPDDRSDVLYHHFEGGGITVQGPSVLIRKKVGDAVSFSYQYYLDMISSASIDVVSQASPYKEHRTQQNVGVDFLHNNTLYSAGYISSIEPDYNSKTAFLNISQSLFGDLTTINFGYTQGSDAVGRVDKGVVQPFRADADRKNYAVGLSQVLTRNMLLGLNFEVDSSAGYLHSPYRSVRYVDPTVLRGYSYQPERYPDTRTSNAASLQLKYYLPLHSALDGSYRFFGDTWGIRASTYQVGYTQSLWNHWTLDGSVRYYTQTHADFYSDLFPYANAQNFLARDRELAQFHSRTFEVGASYEFHPGWPHFIEKGSLNLDVERMFIDYEDFRDVLDTQYKAGQEPLYTLEATVGQFFISFWY
ncbi:MAG TPA: DUF3570 domain-containing protein [Steroidobacteraceae bacterium]|nr:DUF3570 domain-containing protein [Steroidobacteraceae bacterium]